MSFTNTILASLQAQNGQQQNSPFLRQLFPHLPFPAVQQSSLGEINGIPTPEAQAQWQQPTTSSDDTQYRNPEPQKGAVNLDPRILPSVFNPNDQTDDATNDSPDTSAVHRGPVTDLPQSARDALANARATGQAMPELTGSPNEQALQRAYYDAQHPVNQDHGIKGRLKELLQNFLYSTGEAYRQDPHASVGGLLATGAAGAGLGSLNRGWNEQRQAESDIPRLQQQVMFEGKQKDAAAERQYKRDLGDYASGRLATQRSIADQNNATKIELSKKVGDHINQRADIKAGTAKPVVNAKGQLELEFLNADSNGKRKPNELQLGADGQPIMVPGEEGVEWTDPATGQTSVIKAKQGLMPSATIAAANAGRTDTAARFNAEKMWQTDKENINNQMEYHKQVNNLLTSAITAESGLSVDHGAQSKGNDAYQELQQLYNQPLPATDDPSKAQEQRMKRVQALTDTIRSSNEKILNDLEKSDAGKAKAAEIRSQIKQLHQPSTLTYTPYKPTQVGGGVTGIPKVSVSEDEFRNKLKANGVPQAQWSGYISQARHDGVIK